MVSDIHVWLMLTLLLAIFKCHVCFMWYEECDVIPITGCTCSSDADAPHVWCIDLDLDQVPELGGVNVEHLDLSNNSINRITGNCFGNTTPKGLVLSNNKGTLDFESCSLRFPQRIALVYLELCNNGLVSVPSIIRFMSNLETLDLSDNNIRAVRQYEFYHVNGLHRLRLKGNPLQVMDSILFGTPRLNEISLSFDRNLITVAHVSDVTGSYNMALMQLLVNKLTLEQSPIKSAKFLQSFSNLESLRMTRCKLKDRILNKSHMSLLYKSRRSVQFVDLSQNLLTAFPSYLLFHCSQLRHLDLSSNHIDDLTFESSQHPELTYLDASHNLLRTVDPLFHGLSKLTHLDLSSNLISQIRGDVFRSTQQLQNLDLSTNRIRVLPESVFSGGVPHAITIHIGDNRLVCDEWCDTQWLVWRLGEQHVSGMGPFSWYDVYNTRCTDRSGRTEHILYIFLHEAWYSAGCNFTIA